MTVTFIQVAHGKDQYLFSGDDENAALERARIFLPQCQIHKILPGVYVAADLNGEAKKRAIGARYENQL